MKIKHQQINPKNKSPITQWGFSFIPDLLPFVKFARILFTQ
nr:MAG TPA: hypothetical protein [Caudoviricetes sp.]